MTNVEVEDFKKLIDTIVLAVLARRHRISQQESDPRRDRCRECPVLVAVAGTAGSGKTTLCKSLAKALNNGNTCTDTGSKGNIGVAVVPLDGYHRYRTELDAMPDPALAHTRRGAPYTFDPERYVNDLTSLLSMGCAEFPSFEHEIKDPVERDIKVDGRPKSYIDRDPTDFGQHEVVIIEGIYALFTGCEQGLPDLESGIPNPASIPDMSVKEKAAWQQAAHLYDIRAFVQIDLALSTERLTKRHMAAWGIPREEAHLRASGSDLDNGRIVCLTAKNADIVLRSVELAADDLERVKRQLL